VVNGDYLARIACNKLARITNLEAENTKLGQLLFVFQPPIILSWNIAILSGKYEARIAIFCIFAAIDRFSRISQKLESH
jgi:hypothetical protein